MPELPEVENTRRYLVEVGLPWRTFTLATIGWANSVKHPALEDFVLDLPGGKVEEINRRGKYLILPLSAGPTLVLHLGMTGGLRVHPREQPPPPMVRHVLDLDDGRQLRFIDPRKFGHLWLVDDVAQVIPNMGPEPLHDDFDGPALAALLGSRKAPIKALLLEQSIIAGLGNFYADEALYLSGIHPAREALSLTPGEFSTLRDGIVTALNNGLTQYDESRRAEWPDPPFGLSTWSIPRTLGAPCLRCRTPMENMRVRARSTFYCPNCQPSAF